MTITTEMKAAYIVGLYAGLNTSGNHKKIASTIKPFANTASEILDGGAFNPLSVWEMEAEFDRIMDESARQAVARN